MPIKYTYLTSNTDFDANELNLRFEPFLADKQGFNALTIEDLSMGALRHNHVPRLIQKPEYSYTELTEATFPNQNRFSTHRNRLFGDADSVGIGSSVDICTHTQTPDAITLGMTQDFSFFLGEGTDSVAAVIILANVCIQRFVMEEDATVPAPREDHDYVQASIVIEDSTGPASRQQIATTQRALSPRVTINYGTSGAPLVYPTPGASPVTQSFDNKTNQDISIRTVVTNAELEALGLVDIKKVAIRLTPRGGGFLDTASSVEYNKANLTVIPIHAKLNAT